MFESLGYAERRFSRRRMLALPMAAAIQMTLGTTYVVHYLFTAENLIPPPVWISAYPAIPVTLHSPPARPPQGNTSGVKPPKSPGLVEPNTKDPAMPLPSDTPASLQDNSAYDPNALPGVPGLPEGTDINFGPETPARPADRPPILQGTDVTPPRLLRQVPPVYPAAALAMRLGGKVVLQVVVNEEGRVVDVQVVSSSNTLFNQAALDAVKQWRYTSPLAKAGGQAVACYQMVSISFEPR